MNEEDGVFNWDAYRAEELALLTPTTANVQQWVDQLTHVAQADATDIRALRQLGVDQFRHVVVSIGTDLEASVLTVLALQELGVPDIWAKALSKRHGLILERTGAHHVVYPETSMGERVAHLVTGKMLEFIEFDEMEQAWGSFSFGVVATVGGRKFLSPGFRMLNEERAWHEHGGSRGLQTGSRGLSEA